MEVRGKTALVTGAGRRIGRTIAIALGQSGARVAVHYLHSADDAAETADAIRALGADAETFQADLGDPEQVAGLAANVAEAYGSVEILVNNASMFGKQTLSDASVEDWDRYLAVNTRAPFLLAQAMHAGLPEGAPGKIINLNDWRTARKMRFGYGVSKAALSGLTRSLAEATAPNVQVNEIALGAILPPADGPQNVPRSEIKMDLGPADRMGTLNEVAQAILSLIENDFITGETIRLDGGRHIQ